MKTLIVVAVIFCSSLINYSYAKGTIDMHKKLDEVVKFKDNELPITKNQTEFVKVSFKINKNGIVEVLEINYSDEAIKSQLIEKLSEMKVEEEHDSEKVYNYNFTFMKK
ncbi:MAG: hypothetical protein JKX68_04785 [Flavobacteriales bacterium]|nr:hypothetical protein [Flavobacteriales bacterium]